MVPEHLDSLKLSKIETMSTPSTWYYPQCHSCGLHPSWTGFFRSSALRSGIAGSERFYLQGLRSQFRCFGGSHVAWRLLIVCFSLKHDGVVNLVSDTLVKIYRGLDIRVERSSILQSVSLFSPASRSSNIPKIRTLCVQYLSVCFLQHSPLP